MTTYSPVINTSVYGGKYIAWLSYTILVQYSGIANEDPSYNFPHQVDYRTIETEYALDDRSAFRNYLVLHISWMKPLGSVI